MCRPFLALFTIVLGLNRLQGLQLVPATAGQYLELTCPTNGSVMWKVLGNPETLIEDAGENFEVEENVLTIIEVDVEEPSIYQCLSDSNDIIETFTVEKRFSLQRLAKSYSISEGASTEDLLRCTFKQERMVKFQWLSRYEDTEDSIDIVEESERVSITEGVDAVSKYPFSILSIS